MSVANTWNFEIPHGVDTYGHIPLPGYFFIDQPSTITI